MSSAPFSLRIFVANGDPDGLRVVERSNWVGKAIMFPRSLFPAVRSRLEFDQTGVYLLLGHDTEALGEMLYIGEGDPVKPRLESHYAKKDFWTRAVFFVAGHGQLNKAHVQYLEAQLVARAKAAKQMALDNGNEPTEPTLSEADRADMDVFLHNILGILPILGIHAFESSPSRQTLPETTAILHCQGRGVAATGYDSPQGFVVQKGSQASKDEVPSMSEHVPSISNTRSELQKTGVLTAEGPHLVFTQNFTFTSPSLASAVVLGRNSNGRIDWKDAKGRTLKQIQEAESRS